MHKLPVPALLASSLILTASFAATAQDEPVSETETQAVSEAAAETEAETETETKSAAETETKSASETETMVFPFGNFKTKDMNGEEVTNEIFSGYDLTMVNVWTTWCGYCVQEMPDLAEMYLELDDNVNFITVCMDANQSRDAAVQILKDSNAEFLTVAGYEDMMETFCSIVEYLPSTVYVDRDGNICGSYIQGMASIDVYKSELENRLEEILAAKEAETGAETETEAGVETETEAGAETETGTEVETETEAGSGTAD